MNNPIYPGASWNPGAAAGYAKGHNSVECCKCHYTVGRASTGIGLNGYFQFLISRDGTVQQFAEVDALCWDSGEHNGTGPGIEVEYLDEDEIFTAEGRQVCGALVHWLSTEWGIPLVYHDGDHDTPVGAYRGFISHRSLIQTEEHQDYWPQQDWDAMAQTSAQEAHVLYKATTDATNNAAVKTGTVWDLAGTRFLKIDAVPAGAVVLSVTGDEIGTVSAELTKLQQAADKTLGGGPVTATATLDYDKLATAVADKLAARLKD